jgi:hypothetical protein
LTALLDVHLAVLAALDHARILQVDQVLLLHGPHLVEDLVGGVNSIKAENDQVLMAHYLLGNDWCR